MPDVVRWLLAAFAAYRLARFVAVDDGPFDLFLRFRMWAGAYEYGEDGRPTSNLGRWAQCPYCSGVWFAALCAVPALWPSPVGDVALAVLGLAGVQAVLNAICDGRG